MNIHVLCADRQQIKAALECDFVDEVIAESDICDADKFIDECHSRDKKAAIVLPYVFRDETGASGNEVGVFIKETDTLNCFDEVYVRSLDELGYCIEKNIKPVSDYGLYSMNSRAAAFLKREGITRLTAPVELKERELYELGIEDKELIVYGYIPMMVSAQCIRKNVYGCDKTPQTFTITDRKGNKLPVQNKCSFCYNLIYNPVPMSLLGVWNKIEKLNPDTVRVNFTIEDADRCHEVLNALKEKRDPDGEYTRGHMGRGVE